MIGIGVGIDYVLFIVTRYRAALHSGLEPRAAVITAITTSGRAVIFAGCTVIISLLGLFVMNLGFLRVRGRRRRRGARGDAGVGHVAAGHARLHRIEDRPAARAVREPQRFRRSPFALLPVEPRRAAAPVARRDRVPPRAARTGGARAAHALRLPRRGQQPEELHDAQRVRLAQPRLRPRVQRPAAARRDRQRRRPRSCRCPGRRTGRAPTPMWRSSVRPWRAPTTRSRSSPSTRSLRPGRRNPEPREAAAQRTCCRRRFRARASRFRSAARRP